MNKLVLVLLLCLCSCQDSCRTNDSNATYGDTKKILNRLDNLEGMLNSQQRELKNLSLCVPAPIPQAPTAEEQK